MIRVGGGDGYGGTAWRMQSGLARTLGTFGTTAAAMGEQVMVFHGGTAMQFANDQERLVAEQALLNYRELQRIMHDAPHGKAMAVLEQAVREKGFAQMRQTLSLLASAHQEAQKKGSTRSGVPVVEARPISSGASASTC
jgi:hypothetical protein